MDWKFRSFNLITAYGFYAPTGRFKLGASNNVGKGFWTNLFLLGGSYHSLSKLPWNITTVVRYEIHGQQRGQNLTPGNTFTFDGGIGKFVTPSLNIGIVGFAWKQVSNATGSAAIDVLPYRLFGLGIAAQYTIKKWGISIRLRDYYEFSARNSTEGNAIFPSISVIKL